ncbi:MAG TPA: DUF4878 domain-containing protein [Glycomyces sp.]|nr:DUF4878 domain-containing protein [Glycomyces sp.]
MSSNASFRRATAVIGGAFALALTLAACGGNNDTPDGAVENFFDNGVEDITNAIAEGDFAGAAENGEEHFCADDVAAIKDMEATFEGMSDEERDQALDMMAEDVKVPDDWSYEIGEVTEDGDTATVEVAMTEGDETTDETIDLVKEDDAWKVCGFLA